MQTVLELKKQIQSCQKCPLFQLIPNGLKPNIGYGSAKASLMIVVPNSDHRNMIISKPISEEEEIILLTSLKSAGLHKETYITPIVKCGPLIGIKNAKICLDWIREEIDTISPKHVLFLGTALNRFYLMDWPINKSWFRMSPISIFRAGKKDRDKFIEHLRNIKECLL